jgi:hypothetical protein
MLPKYSWQIKPPKGRFRRNASDITQPEGARSNPTAMNHIYKLSEFKTAISAGFVRKSRKQCAVAKRAREYERTIPRLFGESAEATSFSIYQNNTNR